MNIAVNFMIKQKNNFNILSHENCTFKVAGNVVEVIYSQHKKTDIEIQRLNKYEYYDKRTGEVFAISAAESRFDDLANVRKSLVAGRDMINANCANPDNVRWATLTYADNMQDTKKLYNDYRNCIKRLHEEYGEFNYITAAEPQGRGAWHMHSLLCFDTKAPYIANESLSRCWKQGFVNIKSVQNTNNVGAYLSGYLIDMPESDYLKQQYALVNPNVVEHEDSEGLTKRYVKGARLPLYPAGMHIFRWSKGCKRPEEYQMPYQQVSELLQGATKTYENAFEVFNDDGISVNRVKHEFYNLRA